MKGIWHLSLALPHFNFVAWGSDLMSLPWDPRGCSSWSREEERALLSHNPGIQPRAPGYWSRVLTVSVVLGWWVRSAGDMCGVRYLDLAPQVGAFRERPSKRVEQPGERGWAGSRILWRLKVLTEPTSPPGCLVIFVYPVLSYRCQQGSRRPQLLGHEFTDPITRKEAAPEPYSKQIWLLLFWIQQSWVKLQKGVGSYIWERI